MMASRVTLDSQGRLILRENGKIILPFEHFANAVMLKHMNGPHGLHLGIEATVRAVSNVNFNFTCIYLLFYFISFYFRKTPSHSLSCLMYRLWILTQLAERISEWKKSL